MTEQEYLNQVELVRRVLKDDKPFKAERVVDLIEADNIRRKYK